ncbi:hypothetical protein J1N35_003764 [Gossypium stocksii]|uniref:non-specific serine/threonine protein kinase n=1 Tax=Gossypium stocksii TaxID=47602 RepID=A0A9D4AH19_9ROSI|nr:hypothetical protein J1N35_003764 [Gossypium stocksii]
MEWILTHIHIENALPFLTYLHQCIEFYWSLQFGTALDTIRASKSVKDPEFLISQGGVFRLGFFSFANSTNRYVGILYSQIPVQTVVWVANRNRPLKDSSGILTISDDGNLVVLNGKAETLWSTNVTNLVPNATTAQLLDSGNLVLNNGDNGGSSSLWESFQQPSNVFLQTMKMGVDLKTGRKVHTRSWKGPDDPSDGNFSQGLEPFNIPEGVIRNNSQIYFRTGPWNGHIYIGLIHMNTVYLDGFYVVADDEGKSYYETYEYSNKSMLIYYELDYEGRFVERYWDAGKGDWINSYHILQTDCDFIESVGHSESAIERNDPFALPLFNFEELATATNNFHPSKKLGQGGFGPVYKGTLDDGKEIAVKRLSKASGQGLEEFMNEVVVISKLQHRNLVRLFGCCVEAEEKMLVYEFMPNKSLDAFLFDPIKQRFLDWRKRFKIIKGISRELLYLHRDSRLRIVHRDLKASNVLLDQDLNPKILDFGMARIFGGDENQANTKRVVGTYGYMSPEYAMEGQFSEKLDVFSYGILLLEIVSGRRNTSFYNNKDDLSLLGYAWKLWEEGNVWGLVDKVILESKSDSNNEKEIWRCIHVGLLCVQEYTKDRPTISTVISMLNSEISYLNTPKQPAFTQAPLMSHDVEDRGSLNDVTLTNLDVTKIRPIALMYTLTLCRLLPPKSGLAKRLREQKRHHCMGRNSLKCKFYKNLTKVTDYTVMGKTISCSVLVALISCFYLQLQFGTASHTITASKSIKDPDVIISQNGVFQLGFFSLANSSNRYVGILYHQIPVQTVVWVANRNRPLKDSSGFLTISDDGNLVVSNGKAEILWSTNITNLVPNATTAQLLDSGNLVLDNGEKGGSSILWESFQHPSNVFLQTMKISTDVKTGRKVQTRSWKSPDDPSDGNFFQGIEPFSIPEGVVWNNNQIYSRTGPWNGRIYIGLINVNRVYFDGFYVVADDVEKTYYETYEYSTDSRLIYYELESDGRFVERIWDAGKGDWITGYSSYRTDCDVYGKCGPFGICDSTKRPICSCLKGFKPTNIEEWSRGNWSSGCFRTTPLHCQRDNNNGSEAGQGDDGFLKLKKTKVPAFPDQSSITNGECKDQCMKNCSCVAYAYDAGIGCMLWSVDLIDVQKYSTRGVDLYIRLPSSELGKLVFHIDHVYYEGRLVGRKWDAGNGDWINSYQILQTECDFCGKCGAFGICDPTKRPICSCSKGFKPRNTEEWSRGNWSSGCFRTTPLQCQRDNNNGSGGAGQSDDGFLKLKTMKVPAFPDRSSIINGECKDQCMKNCSCVAYAYDAGIGCMLWSGDLIDVQEIPHTRSRSLHSSVIFGTCLQLIASLICISGRNKRHKQIKHKSYSEKVGESSIGVKLQQLPLFNFEELATATNNFHPAKKLGQGGFGPVYKGTLDVGKEIAVKRLSKASGQGLEEFMSEVVVISKLQHRNLVRLLGGCVEAEEKMLLYEFMPYKKIVNERRNTSFYNNRDDLSLLGYAWKLWREGNTWGLIDKVILESKSDSNNEKELHVGLLCVQEYTKDRPIISTVISMLNSEISNLNTPKQPAVTQQPLMSHDVENRGSLNDVTLTKLDGQ